MPILNDTLLEIDEVFNLSLSLPEEQNLIVELRPQNATVAIFDIHGVGKYKYLYMQSVLFCHNMSTQ